MIPAFELLALVADDEALGDGDFTGLESATCIEDLMQLPSNRFESLTGDRDDQYSIMINKQWRICFNWREAPPGAENVEITDYH